MTQVSTVREAYNLATAPRLHKFRHSAAPVFAYVLAYSEAQARELILPKIMPEDREHLTYLGAKPLHELKPCVLLNQFCPF